MRLNLTRFINDESGATVIEYGLIAALLSVVAIASYTKLGTSMSAMFTKIANSIT